MRNFIVIITNKNTRIKFSYVNLLFIHFRFPWTNIDVNECLGGGGASNEESSFFVVDLRFFLSLF